jgi:GTPase SAR1 family protein
MGKNIIEFIGPPGVGKTAIYRALCRHWQANHNWIYQDALLAPKKPPIFKLAQWMEYNTQVVLGRKLAKALPVESGLRFVNNNKELAAFCWNHLSDPTFFNDQSIGKRFRAAYFLFLDFCRYQAIQENENGCHRSCIIDEGLLQKSFLIHDNQEVMLAAIKQYLAVIPLPYATIYIDTPDKEIIKQRLHSRRKTLHPYFVKNETALLSETGKWQYLLQLIADIIEEKKVLIYRVDGAKPINENVRLIYQFLARIN